MTKKLAVVLAMLIAIVGCAVASADEPNAFLSPVAHLPLVSGGPGGSTSTPTPTTTSTATPVPTNTSTLTPTYGPTPTPCVIEVTEWIQSDKTWQANCTYIADDGIFVESYVTLTIPEGVTVLMGDWKTFHVYGRLIAQGAPDNMIYIRGLYGGKLWTGIHLDQGEPDYLDYVSVWGSNSNFSLVDGISYITNCFVDGAPYVP